VAPISTEESSAARMDDVLKSDPGVYEVMQVYGAVNDFMLQLAPYMQPQYPAYLTSSVSDRTDQTA
jgi:hypothetical protein